MTQRFLITGLPRSRTAWMAAFTSCGPAFCYHEPSAMMGEIEDLEDVYARPGGYQHVGASDHGLGFWITEILARFKPRTLVIMRDQQDVEQSMHELGMPATNFCELLTERLLAVRQHPLVQYVPFEALDDMATMRKAWFHLLPGVPFDEGRYREFSKFHIELTQANFREIVRRLTKTPHPLYSKIVPFLHLKDAPYVLNS